MSTMLRAEPLTREAFSLFGDVIETRGAHHYPINHGWAERYHDLARLTVADDVGKPGLSIFRAAPRQLPIAPTMMERHRLGSQTFVPLSPIPFLILVAPAGPAPRAADELRLFISVDQQGVNYLPGVWHHPLLALQAPCDFLVIDRIAPTADCEEISIASWDIEMH